MITSVATWRCKRGTMVKVITEMARAHADQPSCLKASCPTCGDEQVSYGDRIVSVEGSGEMVDIDRQSN